MKSINISDLNDKIVVIIKKETPEKAIDKISFLNNPKTGKKFGKNVAYQIYLTLSHHSVPYVKKIHENNYLKWASEVSEKLKKAKDYIS